VVAEPGTDTVAQAWTAADSVVAARLLYPEARAGLAAALRGGRVPQRLYRGRKAALEELWREFDIVEITPTLAQSAGDLAERLGLRGYDAVHLAAVLHIQADALVTAAEDLLRTAPAYSVGLIDARS
jgi:predicted nucleic acid-binding protein